MSLLDIHHCSRTTALCRYVRAAIVGSGGKLLQMMCRIAELQVDHQQTLEVVTDAQLFGHAHAAVQLHGIFADADAGFTDQMLEGVHGAFGGAPDPALTVSSVAR